MTLCVFLAGCGEPNERLDEYLFYSGPQLKLKVVRYYRNIPFNYLGEHAVVMCQSEHTREFLENDPDDSGWRILGEAGGPGSRDAREVAQAVKNDYRVRDDRILIVTTQAINISLDACGHFASWDPGRLPPEMIDAVEKPDSCAPAGPVDCRNLDFEGVRLPRYQEINISDDGTLAFTVSSPAFKAAQALHVQSTDKGNLWHVKIVNRDNATQNPPLQRLPALPVQHLGDGMEATGLAVWLATALPPHSMVIWPESLMACSEPSTRDDRNPVPRCAEIRFSDHQGNSGALQLTMTDATDNTAATPAFHSGHYASAGQIRPITSLRELPGLFTARPRP